jgi:hypothetical protein
MPGDVGVRDNNDGSDFVRVIEVRDKNVPLHAALAFAIKVADASVSRAVLVAIAADQEVLNAAELRQRAREMGVDFELFTNWAEIVRAIFFASEQKEYPMLEVAIPAIRNRLIQLELSTEAIAQWDELTIRQPDRSSDDPE